MSPTSPAAPPTISTLSRVDVDPRGVPYAIRSADVKKFRWRALLPGDASEAELRTQVTIGLFSFHASGGVAMILFGAGALVPSILCAVGALFSFGVVVVAVIRRHRLVGWDLRGVVRRMLVPWWW